MTSPSSPSSSEPQLTRTVLAVPDISCHHCQTAIEGAVSALAGVAHVDVSIPDHQVELTYDPQIVLLSQIVTAIHEQGYELIDV